MYRVTSRHYFIVLLVCIALIGTALYMQYSMGLEPCPLCALTRIVVIAFGFLTFLALILRPLAIRKFLSLLMAITSLIGLGVSGRHLWLQSLPADEVPNCGPGLDYIVDAFPFLDALKMILAGSGECAEVSWRFIGLSIPGWMMVFFVAALVFSIMSYCTKKKRSGFNYDF